uniref:Legume lectin domain-containing protein n=1 Tax=Oryza brachyantha TaxID=4533 RepID=J3LV28_ORYBR
MYIGFSSATGIVATHHYVLGWSFSLDGPTPQLDFSKLPPSCHGWVQSLGPSSWTSCCPWSRRCSLLLHLPLSSSSSGGSGVTLSCIKTGRMTA